MLHTLSHPLYFRLKVRMDSSLKMTAPNKYIIEMVSLAG